MDKDDKAAADKGSEAEQKQADDGAVVNKIGDVPGAPVHPPVVKSTAVAPEAADEKPATAETTATR